MSARKRPPNGLRGSTTVNVGLGGDAKSQDKKCEILLAKVFDRAQAGLREEVGSEEYERRRHDFIFHMMDWKSDIQTLAAILDDPRKMGTKEATTFIIGFLYHVIPHLKAAGRLLLDEVPDPFEIESRSET